MKNMRLRRWLAAAATAATCLALVACSSGSDGGLSTASSSGTPAAKGGSGQTFTIATAQGIASLDPAKILFGWDQVTYSLVFDSLTAYTDDGGDEVQPALATKWQASDDLKTYTFTLRDGVKFSSGAPMTADDVVDNFKRYLNPDTGWFWRTSIAGIEKVTAVDSKTVKMTLSAPSRSLPTAVQIAPIVDLKGAALKAVARKPIGTGPFVVDSFTPNGQIVLKRNPDYWGDPAPSEQLTIDRAPDSTSAVTSLRSGSLSALWNIPWPDVKSIEAGGTDVKILTQEQPSAPLILEVDNTSPPFDNPKARQALARAIDRDVILKTVYAGKGTTAPTNSPIPTDSSYADSSLPSAAYDLDEAKKLFAEAGIGEGDTLTYWTPGAGQYPDMTSIGQILQSDLKKIGINLKIETRELNTWAAKFAPPGKKWPGFIIPNFYTGLAVPGVMTFWNPGICECNYDSKAYSKALADADAEADEAKSVALYGQAQQIFSEDTPVGIVVQTSSPIGLRNDAQGVWIDPTGSPRFEDAAMGGG